MLGRLAAEAGFASWFRRRSAAFRTNCSFRSRLSSWPCRPCPQWDHDGRCLDHCPRRSRIDFAGTDMEGASNDPAIPRARGGAIAFDLKICFDESRESNHTNRRCYPDRAHAQSSGGHRPHRLSIDPRQGFPTDMAPINALDSSPASNGRVLRDLLGHGRGWQVSALWQAHASAPATAAIAREGAPSPPRCTSRRTRPRGSRKSGGRPPRDGVVSNWFTSWPRPASIPPLKSGHLGSLACGCARRRQRLRRIRHRASESRNETAFQSLLQKLRPAASTFSRELYGVARPRLVVSAANASAPKRKWA